VSLEWWVSDLWGHHGLQRLIKDLNAVYRSHPALWQLDADPAGFEWINADDAGRNTYAWVRQRRGRPAARGDRELQLRTLV
jgi:1,4-alpha-glucan branching enzyme